MDSDYQKALLEEDPRPEDLFTHEFAPTPVTEEKGVRSPVGKQPTVMVDPPYLPLESL